MTVRDLNSVLQGIVDFLEVCIGFFDKFIGRGYGPAEWPNRPLRIIAVRPCDRLQRRSGS